MNNYIRQLNCRVTIACCVLHNIAIDRNRPFDEPIDWSSDDADMHDPLDETIGNQSDTLARRRGNEKRDRVAMQTFSGR